LAGTRRYASTTPAAPKKASNAPLYFIGAGIVGLAGYLYIEKAGNRQPIQEKSPFDPQNFVDFKLKKIVPYNHNTSTFVFEIPKDEASLLPVASCLVVKSSDPEALKDAKGKPIIRPYTPVSSPTKRGEFSLLVKKYENGNASKYIHELKARFPSYSNKFGL
ncbi:hypothetical protein H0H93_013599, partial [Arthromyces matolae]